MFKESQSFWSQLTNYFMLCHCSIIIVDNFVWCRPTLNQ
jgi:hypothetical protein